MGHIFIDDIIKYAKRPKIITTVGLPTYNSQSEFTTGISGIKLISSSRSDTYKIYGQAYGSNYANYLGIGAYGSCIDVLDLGEQKTIKGFEYYGWSQSGVYAIRLTYVYLSQDNSNWVTVYNTSTGNVQQSLNLGDTKYRYVKIGYSNSTGSSTGRASCFNLFYEKEE